MKIYSLKDRLNVKIGDVTVVFSPLTLGQKSEVQALMGRYQDSKNVKDIMDGSCLAIKYAVKDLIGAENSAGEAYKLEFDTNGYLTDTSVEDLLNSEISTPLNTIVISLLSGIPTEIINPTTGKPLEGVTILNPTKERRKK